MVAELADLAVAVVFARKGPPVGPPRQHAAVLHEHGRMPGPGMGIPGQFRRPLGHLLPHMAAVAVQRPLLGPLPWLTARHPLAPKTNSPPPPMEAPGGPRPGKDEREFQAGQAGHCASMTRGRASCGPLDGKAEVQADLARLELLERALSLDRSHSGAVTRLAVASRSADRARHGSS